MAQQTQRVQRTKLCQKQWGAGANQDGFNSTFISFNESILLEKKGKARGRVTLLMLHPCTLLPPVPWGDTGDWWTSLYTGLVGRVGLSLLAAQTPPWRALGAFAAHDTLPCERGELTAQQLQTCLPLFQEKPSLSQQDSSFCNEPNVCHFPPPGFHVGPRNSNECTPKHKFSTLSFQAVGSQGVACGSLGTRKMGKKWCMEQL